MGDNFEGYPEGPRRIALAAARPRAPLPATEPSWLFSPWQSFLIAVALMAAVVGIMVFMAGPATLVLAPIIAIAGALATVTLGMLGPLPPRPAPPPKPSLKTELIEQTRIEMSRLDAIVERIRDQKLQSTTSTLLSHAMVFLRHARNAPSQVLAQQRFITYYLPQTRSLLEAHARMMLSPSLHTEDIARIEPTLRELIPVFSHYASAIARGGAPNMDLEIRLLRDSIEADLPQDTDATLAPQTER